jgi:hypothetical protein
VGGHGVAVVGDVGDDEHPGIGRAALHQLPRRARLEAAALVVSSAFTSSSISVHVTYGTVSFQGRLMVREIN